MSLRQKCFETSKTLGNASQARPHWVRVRVRDGVRVRVRVRVRDSVPEERSAEGEGEEGVGLGLGLGSAEGEEPCHDTALCSRWACLGLGYGLG